MSFQGSSNRHGSRTRTSPHRRVGTLALALLLHGALTGTTAVAQTDDHAAVRAAVVDAMEAQGVPGVGVALIDDYEVVWAEEFGLAEPGRPVGPRTLFQAASLSKPVAALVAAAAAEEGLVDLDADALAHTRSWHHPPPWWDGPITLRMLLAHRGGVNVHGFPGYAIDEPLPDLTQILDGVLDKNPPIRVDSPPGERKYSGGGYLIAELAIEEHCGRSIEEMAESFVFAPLGLELSTYRLLDASDRARVAVGYRTDGSEVVGGWHQYPETAPAALWTTAREYAALVADVMLSYEKGTGVVLDRATARGLLDPDFAVGFGVGREPGGISMGHDGANEGYRCRFVALPDRGQGIVVFTNSDAGAEVAERAVAAAAAEWGWPGSGWSTPLWAVLLVAALLGALAFVGVRRCRPATPATERANEGRTIRRTK